MEKTLMPSDIILVNKLKFGPKIPSFLNEIPWLNFEQVDKNGINAKSSYKRLSGMSNIKNGDVIVFENFNVNTFFVKRCIGTPGDTLSVLEGNFYINNSMLNYNTKFISNKYRFKILNKNLLYKYLDSLSINNKIYKDNEYSGYYCANFTEEDINSLKIMKCLNSVNRDIKPYKNGSSFFITPNTKRWTIDNFGPFKIPKKGYQINLNKKTLLKYQTILEKYENIKIEIIGKNYYFNNKITKSYIFKKNYFFVVGDNRKNSYDSRFFGLIPEQNIIGKVDYILYSKYDRKFSRNKFLSIRN